MPYYFRVGKFECMLYAKTCGAKTKTTGKRCKRKCIIGFEYCHSHMKTKLHVQKRGEGLFAFQHTFSSNDPICSFNGEFLTKTQMIERYGKSAIGPYLQQNNHHIIDCACKRSIGTFARVQSNNTNARFHWDNDHLTIVATQEIEQGEEIIVLPPKPAKPAKATRSKAPEAPEAPEPPEASPSHVTKPGKKKKPRAKKHQTEDSQSQDRQPQASQASQASPPKQVFLKSTGEIIKRPKLILTKPLLGVVEARQSPIHGRGLFAIDTITKGEPIATYSGRLYERVDQASLDKTYMVDFEKGRGRILLGDSKDKDLGLYANSILPNESKAGVNAKLDTSQCIYYRDQNNHLRARFLVMATRNIEQNQEILVNYGSFYWKNFE